MEKFDLYDTKVDKYWSYMKALRALREGRNTNSAHKDAFNSLISDLRKKNPHWDRKSVDDHGSTTRALFTEENSDGEKFDLYDRQRLFNLKYNHSLLVRLVLIFLILST